MKTNLTVIILTYNEKLHIRRCLENVFQLNPKQVFVVDSPSTDGTDVIAAEMGATVVAHKYPGNQAAQFNWALDNLPIEGEWILRLDADEYLFPETIEEVKSLLPKWDNKLVTSGGLPPDVTSLSLSRARTFAGKRIKWGGAECIELVRFFKYGIGRSQNRAMDEHIVTSEGTNYKLKGLFIDDNLQSFEWWKQKHLNYAEREARQALEGVRGNKALYYKLPPYLRVFAYFCYRYFIRLGFLDGRAGWQWNFWQGLWYRWTVDKRIQEMKRERRD